MNVRRDVGSPWGVRVFFEPAEFDAMMVEVLFRAGPDAFKDGDGVDVHRVLLDAYQLEADYVDLPDGILGRTLFKKDGSARIEVSRALAEDAETDQVARRRLRATLAHEGGHVTCHRQLFVADLDTMPLFPEPAEPEKPAILCRDTSVGAHGYSGEWWEFQANQCMAGLLLPKHLFTPRVKAQLAAFELPTATEVVKNGRGKEFIRTLADLFDVNGQSVLYRLQEFGFLPKIQEVGQQQIAF